MSLRILEAVGVIGNYLLSFEIYPNRSEIYEELRVNGFSTHEIKEAFFWIEEKTIHTQRYASVLEKVRPPLRILSVQESLKIESTAYAYLLQLVQIGVVDPFLMEQILEFAMAKQVTLITRKNMRHIATFTIFEQLRDEWKNLLDLKFHESH